MPGPTDTVRLEIKAAGLDASEWQMDPVHGLLVAPSGVRKMAALSGDPAVARELRAAADQAETATRRRQN